MTMLSEWRKRVNLTQREAAKALGVTLKTYSELELGTRYGTGLKVKIDLRTRLACSAIENNLNPINENSLTT